jgi:hypothetical protein
LPSGLTLASNGTISGTLSASAQSSSFTAKVTDSSSPAQSASSLLSISIASGVAATPGATTTQYVMSYTAANSSQCTIEVSTSPTYNQLVHAVDPTIFANANLDGQTNAGSRAFVVGQKWIAQENVAPPSIKVGAASRGASSNLVTVNYANQPFVVGDNITITGMSNSAYNDPWARVEVASANSFRYEVLTAASASGDASGGGSIVRADRYSLALAADTTYYYRIGGAMNTCGASPATGSFTTMNIPNGNTWEEGPVTDNNGLQIFPSVPESRSGQLIDPLTGGLVTRLTLAADSGGVAAVGWDSSFFRPCSLSTTTNGFYTCLVGLGSSGIAGLYSIKGATGESHWLGFAHLNYCDSGNHCGANTYINGSAQSTTDNSDAFRFYTVTSTNSGYVPSKSVLIGNSYTGPDNVDAAPGALMAVGTTTVYTPDPSNTLQDQLHAYNSTFDPIVFGGCLIREMQGVYAVGFCNAEAQGSPAWVFAYNTMTSSVAAAGLASGQPICRWCGNHGTTVTGSQKWTTMGLAEMDDISTGEFGVQLRSAITAGVTTFNVTSPLWTANTAYQTSLTEPSGSVGSTIIDSNGNMEIATTAGTSSSSPPSWNATPGGTTNDGTVVWTNGGAAKSLGEPQNLFARKDDNPNGVYWAFLMPALGARSGGTGGLAGGQYNGDIWQFTDGTKECVRLVTKGPVTGGVATWTVIRGMGGFSTNQCSPGVASAHAAGAKLVAICESYVNQTSNDSMAWDFVDDPHMADTTSTYFVRSTTPSGHGYYREAAPHGATWVSGLVFNQHIPWVASDFTSPAAFSLINFLNFNGINTSSTGVSHQDYTAWDFENASFKDSAIGVSFFVAGGGTGGYGGYALVAGTSTIYKYIHGNAPFSRTLPYFATSGGNTLPDISGPSSLLTDMGTNQVCIVTVAGECWPGSTVGDMYASLSQPVANSICNNGNETAAFLGHDWCMMNGSPYGDALDQYGLIPSNFISIYPNPPFWPQYGAGLSRRLLQNLIGGIRLQNLHPHVVPDGSAAIFESHIADPHISINGANLQVKDAQVYQVVIPPQPPADGIDRTNYETASITIGTGSGGATQARVKYGYEENERMRGTTWPPAIHFYCTQYQGTCYSSDQNLPLSSVKTLPYGVPQRVLFYQVEYLNSTNQVVASDPIMTVAIP